MVMHSMHALAPALIGAAFVATPFAARVSASSAAAPACASFASTATTRRLDREIPPRDGWVLDLAEMLDERQERSLEKLMESYQQDTTHEIALLIVPELDGQSIERLARKIGRTWGIGGEDMQRGALLVISKADRTVRIEVGAELEGKLSDSIRGRIIQGVIVPYFRRADFITGIRQGIESMNAAIGGNYVGLPADRTHRSRSWLRLLIPLPIALLGIAAGIRHINNRYRWRRAGIAYGPIRGPLSTAKYERFSWRRRGGVAVVSGWGGFGGFSGGGATGGW
jgi:uncharacterized protein